MAGVECGQVCTCMLDQYLAGCVLQSSEDRLENVAGAYLDSAVLFVDSAGVWYIWLVVHA